MPIYTLKQIQDFFMNHEKETIVMPRLCKHCHKEIYQEECRDGKVSEAWYHSLSESHGIVPSNHIAEPEEEFMQKSNEYIFKVEKWSQIGERRIVRENPHKEMILVIPDSANDRIIVMVDNQFNAKSQIISEHYWHVDGFICYYDDKANIQKYIDAYNKAQAEKPKPKITVRVKIFGDTLPF